MAFIAGEDEDEVTLDSAGEYFDLCVKYHKYDGGVKVGSCYIEALVHYEDLAYNVVDPL